MPVPSPLFDRLKNIVGPEYVTEELCDRLVYSKDYSIEGIADDYTPDLVVKPGSVEEIEQIVAAASEFKVPLYTWGAGTSMSGNPLAVYHGIVLDIKRMNRILEVDPANLTITVQAGATM
ncbi:MAG: FAD-binding oxidoreductase, partial [Candidatus Thorarchaeota archaeon]